MATNNRPLKAYVRFDGSGRAVSSSLIWRKNKPKVGNWKEVQGYECCNPDPAPTFTPIELCYGEDPCVNNCTNGIYYIYQNVIFGIPVVYLLTSEDTEAPAPDGQYKIVSNGKRLVVNSGAIITVGDCA